MPSKLRYLICSCSDAVKYVEIQLFYRAKNENRLSFNNKVAKLLYKKCRPPS